MRRSAPGFSVVLLVCVFLNAGNADLWAQTSRTAPLPITTVGRTRLFQRDRDDSTATKPAEQPSPIPKTPPGQFLAQQPAAPQANQPADPLLAAVKQAIEINKLRYLDPSRGHTPWMIMHGTLALRQEYELMIGGNKVNAIDYITKQNPLYAASLPDPLKPPGSPPVNVRHHWFQSTVYGGRAQPYVVSFAFEGHTNQFLAILSMADLPLTHTFVVSDSQRPGATKTITMADMVRHAQMNIHIGNPNEESWTLWFLTNYLEPDATWVDKDGHPWSMEQLVTVQTNAPMFDGNRPLAPCGGTHGMFALACACNSYQQKHGKLQGAWLAARHKLDNYIAAAQRMQNQDGSFSTEFFKTTGWSGEMGPRLKSSGHMLEWLMMALPPERLKEPWVQAGVRNVAEDLIKYRTVGLGTSDTGAMYHGLHALVLYRNRVEPPSLVTPPVQVVEVPPEMRKPTPDVTPTPPMPVTPTPMPTPMANGIDKGPMPAVPPEKQPEATIRLANPPKNTLSPIVGARPLLRPITNSKETPLTPPMTIPDPPPMPERITPPVDGEPARIPLLIPPKPLLEKPAPTEKPNPAPSEPKSGASNAKPVLKQAHPSIPVPLFGENPDVLQPLPKEVSTGQKPPAPQEKSTVLKASAVRDERTKSLVPSLPDPPPSKSPSSSD